MTRELAFLLASGLLAGTLPLFGDENLKPPARAVRTEQSEFAPGGVIRVDGSFGDLYIEGWDQPKVEMTVTKSMPFEYDPERTGQRMDAIRVVAEHPSPTELRISTSLSKRRGALSPPLPPHTGGVRMQYQIYVPRNSRLVVHHGVGLVSITGVTADIEATCHRGDLLLWLSANGTYAIDARNKLGKVSSDFAGSSLSRFLVGQQFTSHNPGPAQHLLLRMGFGGITLKPILAESEAKSTLAASTK